jgi:hypothetical protein
MKASMELPSMPRCTVVMVMLCNIFWREEQTLTLMEASMAVLYTRRRTVAATR